MKGIVVLLSILAVLAIFALSNAHKGYVHPDQAAKAIIVYQCIQCGKISEIQATLVEGEPLEKSAFHYPVDDIFTCPFCGGIKDLSNEKQEIEYHSKKKIVECDSLEGPG